MCVIGKTVADDLFGGEQASIGQILRVNKMPFRVLGVLKEKGEGGFGQDQDNVIIAPFRSVQKRILGIDYAMTIMASAMSEESVVLMIGGNIPDKTRVVSVQIYDHVEAMEYAQGHWLSACMLVFSFTVLLTLYTFNPQTVRGREA